MTDSLKVLAIYTQSKNSPSPAIQDQLNELENLGILVETYAIDRSSKFNYIKAAWQMFLRNFRSDSYDIIHAFYGHCGLAAIAYQRAPSVVTFQGSDILGGKEEQMHRKDGMIGSLVAKFVEGVIVMSAQMKRLAGRDDALVIPFGINTSIFYPQSQAEARQALNLDMDKKLVLFPWHPERPEKNFHIAEAAIKQVQEQGHNVEILPIYGKSREEVAQHMNASDVMVLVSDHEGSPVAVREAMGCNLPVVSVDVGDVKPLTEQVIPNAIVERTPEAVAEAISNILTNGQRSNGYEIISKQDSKWSAIRVLPLYKKVLGNNKRAQYVPIIN